MTTLNEAIPEVTVEELTPEQARALFERACHEYLNTTAEEFLEHHAAGEYPNGWARQSIQDVEFLLPFAR
ncbi:MAG TPA: hypothetical protein VHO29_04070 [Marmoricola sp.]|nr:hypothetical protein [Marmoricola sp.]